MDSSMFNYIPDNNDIAQMCFWMECSKGLKSIKNATHFFIDNVGTEKIIVTSLYSPSREEARSLFSGEISLLDLFEKTTKNLREFKIDLSFFYFFWETLNNEENTNPATKIFDVEILTWEIILRHALSEME